MNKVKTLTLTIDEFSQILQITDLALRDAILTAVTEAIDAPESIDLTAYADADPLLISILTRLRTRAESARKRAEKRRSSLVVPRKVTVSQDTKMIEMELNESNVRRLLWVRQHYAETIDNIMRILTSQSHNSLGRELSTCFGGITTAIRAYLRPLFEVAATYFRTPRHLRPRTISIPMNLDPVPQY